MVDDGGIWPGHQHGGYGGDTMGEGLPIPPGPYIDIQDLVKTSTTDIPKCLDRKPTRFPYLSLKIKGK